MTTVAPRVSIVVPTYNTADLLRTCLKLLLRSISHRDDVEIIVSDDGSIDDTTEVIAEFATVATSVRSADNRGFASACNAGAAAAHGRSLVFYNTDLEPTPGWLDELLEYADAHPAAAVVGVKLLFPDGRIQHAGCVLCADGYPRHAYAGFPADHEVVNRSGLVSIVTGACMYMSRRWFEELAGFDTWYTNGYEDVDLCFRVGEVGGEVHYCHRSTLTHLVSATREGRTAEFAESERRFVARWGHRRPDDFDRYLRDGMIEVVYGRYFPFRLRVSPEIAVIDASGEDGYAALMGQLHDVRRVNAALKAETTIADEGSEEPASGLG
ncbi:glycosyltransferase [Nocardia puris]|uniref:glycosyltransferase n=1 Tax=Nocardia puris TaxID=208602 RepID=UPI001E361844|nr:glycosyltransferase [Nocardia puris]